MREKQTNKREKNPSEGHLDIWRTTMTQLHEFQFKIPHLHRIYLGFYRSEVKKKTGHFILVYMFENEKNREMNTQIRLRTRKDHYRILFNSRFSSDTLSFGKPSG